VLSALLWANISRVVRGVVLSLREQEYIEAARAMGASDARIILRHLIPNALGTIIVAATITVATMATIAADLPPRCNNVPDFRTDAIMG